MNRARWWQLAAGVALVLTCGGATSRGPVLELDPAQERALAAEPGPGFRIKRTSHFLIAYDTRPEVVEELTNRLEQTYHMVFQFCDMNGIRTQRPDRRMGVIFFDKRAAYEKYARSQGVVAAGTFGFYLQTTNRSFFFNVANDEQVAKLQAQIAAAKASIDRIEQQLRSMPANGGIIEVRFSDGERIVGTKAEVERKVSKRIDEERAELKKVETRHRNYSDKINQVVIQHETAHQTLTNAGLHVRGANNPKWLVEGLACLFETPPGPPGSGFAVLNSTRLEDFRLAVGGNTKRQLTSRDYDRAVQSGLLASPKQLILQPYMLDARGESGQRNYAVAWALAHYLQRNQREQLAAYLLDISVRMPGDNPSPQQELELFEDHFGPIDDDFLRRFSGYILGLIARPSIGQ